MIDKNNVLQVVALAPLALLLMTEACCAHLVVTHGVVHYCSHTAHMRMMTKLVMKSVTCYKDVSKHDRALQWKQWCPCPRCGSLLLPDLSI